MARYKMNLEPLCEVEAYVSTVPIGPSSFGLRIVAPIVGGTVQGPKIKGKLLPVGGDWSSSEWTTASKSTSAPSLRPMMAP